MPGTNDINRTDLKKRDETNISLAVLSSHTKNKSDILSNNVVMENIKDNTRKCTDLYSYDSEIYPNIYWYYFY